MKNLTSKIIGIFLILLGIGYLGNQFNWWDFSLVYSFLPLLIIILGICSMIDNGFTFTNIIVSIFGVYLFLTFNNLISFRITFQLIFALILLYLGIKLVFFRDRFEYTKRPKNWDENQEKGQNGEEHIYVNTSFTTRKIVNKGKVCSCRIDNNFGSVFLDLREADLMDLKEMRIECIFGNVEVLLPQGLSYLLKKDNIFGGCYADESYNQSEKSLVILESCIFGSVRIRKAKK